MKNLILCGVVCSLLAACGSKSDDAATAPTIAPLGGEGTWTSACTVDPEDATSYVKQIYSFLGSASTFSTYSYGTDSTCADTSLLIFSKVEGNYAAGADVVAPAGFRKINYTITTVTATPNTAEIATYLNSVSAYGYADWAAGTAKDITGKKLASTTTKRADIIPAAGSVIYDIIKISGTTLLDGLDTETLDQSTDAKRPVVQSQFVYTKS